jgi:hypothetical protein
MGFSTADNSQVNVSFCTHLFRDRKYLEDTWYICIENKGFKVVLQIATFFEMQENLLIKWSLEIRDSNESIGDKKMAHLKSQRIMHGSASLKVNTL